MVFEEPDFTAKSAKECLEAFASLAPFAVKSGPDRVSPVIKSQMEAR